MRKRVPLRAMPPARSPVLRASAARCSPRSAAWSKAPTMPRSSACASPSAASRLSEAVRAARPRVDELTRSRDEARAQASDLGLQIAEANDELDRVRRDDSEAAGKLADAKVRLAQTSERLRSLKAACPTWSIVLRASTVVSAEHARLRGRSSCCVCAFYRCTSAIRPCWSARWIGPRACVTRPLWRAGGLRFAQEDHRGCQGRGCPR